MCPQRRYLPLQFFFSIKPNLVVTCGHRNSWYVKAFLVDGFSFFFPPASSWHAACSWFRTCQGSQKPQRNKSWVCWNQKQPWHLTAFSAQWHHVSRTSSGVSTTWLVAAVSGVGVRGASGHGKDCLWTVWAKWTKLLDWLKDLGLDEDQLG